MEQIDRHSDANHSIRRIANRPRTYRLPESCATAFLPRAAFIRPKSHSRRVAKPRFSRDIPVVDAI
jgi:hypothetical protein